MGVALTHFPPWVMWIGVNAAADMGRIPSHLWEMQTGAREVQDMVPMPSLLWEMSTGVNEVWVRLLLLVVEAIWMKRQKEEDSIAVTYQEAEAQLGQAVCI